MADFDEKENLEQDAQEAEQFSVFGDRFDLSNADIFKEDPDVPLQEEEESSSEMPVYDNPVQKTRKRLTGRSILAIVLVVLLCAGLAGGVWLLVRQRNEKQSPPAIEPVQSFEETPSVQAENDTTAPSRVKAKGFPVSFSSNAIRSVSAVGAHLYVLTDETLSLVTSTGAYQLMKVIGYVEPVLRSSGKYGLVFDRLTGKYLIFAGDKILYENKAEEKTQVLDAAIAPDGSYLIASRGNESASILSYYGSDYSEKAEPLFQWSCAKDHIVAVSISENKHDFLCAALNAENGEIVTKLYLLNMFAKETQWEYKLKGAAAIECFFDSSNKVGVVCTDRRIIIDTKKSKADPNVFMYPETLLALDSDDTNTAIVTPKFGSFDAYEVRLLNDNNKEVYVFETNESVIDICTVGKRTYLLTEHAVIAIGTGGKGSVVSQIADVELGLDVLNGQVYHYSLGYLFKN